MSTFNFKQFSISHAQSFKVGTDGVLLGCWADIEQAENILDIGTGSGLIALVIAQRSLPNCEITGIEKDLESFEEAQQNAKKSPWGNRVSIVNDSIQNLETEPFDRIISNPPYFNNSTKSGNSKKDQARHTDTLTFEDLWKSVKRLSHLNTKFSVVLPTVEAEIFTKMAEDYNFFLTRLTKVKTKKEKPIERHLMSFERNNKALVTNELIIQKGGRNEYTEDYILLTKEFYTIL